jgi:hypothetical protein
VVLAKKSRWVEGQASLVTGRAVLRRSQYAGHATRFNQAKLAVRAPPLEPHGSHPTLPTVRATLTNIAEHQ